MDTKDRLANLAIKCTDEEVVDFEAYILRKQWELYNKDRMDKLTIIKNRIDSLPLTFPNGTVGKEYHKSFALPQEDIVDYWLEDIEPIGLKSQVDESTGDCVLSGTPTESGSFSFRLCYRHKGWVKGMPTLERKFTIAINPDPKSLWKNIPTPNDIEYYQPDYECEYVKVESINGVSQKDIVVASQRGRSHAHEGNPRDDHYGVKFLDKSGWYIMAVADGTGSAKYSRKGSSIACETAVSHCEQFFADEANVHDFEEYITTYNNEQNDEYKKMLGDYIYQLVGKAAFSGYKAIESEAKNHNNTPIKYYATTLLLAVCKRFDFGWFVASFWVGDGAMCIYDKDRQYFRILGTPDEGEYSGQTRFLTMPEIFIDATSLYGRLKFSIEKDFTALMLMTDGVSDPKFETDANLNKIEKWNELYEDITKEVDLSDDNVESKSQLLQWLDFWSQGNHDDRTIAILY